MRVRRDWRVRLENKKGKDEGEGVKRKEETFRRNKCRKK